ncbi:FecR domain-containing protein [Pedobacter sp. PLR]|uniref:FecR family protein n=1 Tax=Pedobacter sp. PLR TaxID=2994465 RepID=UPI0022450618|nr:FecR domain-containing protein [Pedobacter sp. PLR]MCX2450450.1 FecR domain-containing protein [Pedobacter sp. PLR]
MPQIERADYVKILERVADGSATDQEIMQYNFWITVVQEKGASREEPLMGNKAQLEQDILTGILLEIHQKPVAKPYKLWKSISIAASILLISGLAFYTFNPNPNELRPGFPKTEIINDILPGSEQATLTLGNGQKIVLDGVVNGKIAEQAGISISKTADGQLVYSVTEVAGKKDVIEADAMNTIATPRGGQYQLNLPDGTKVWLNAASSLKYPVRFSARQRLVELTGEGYFEVAKDPARPFKVKTGTEELQVLGTHFNINSYTDEAARKTTLLEGAVRINSKSWSQPIVLSPGQQAVVSNQGLKILKVNTDEIIDWKNGNFIFQEEPLESIMRKVARWYDVEVKYEGSPGDLTFTGVVSRSKNISAMLNALDKTGKVHFKVAGKVVTVLQ